eukprot:COSAG05_NODE_1965_length_3772_cov_1256.470188_2_plen_299_part_00
MPLSLSPPASPPSAPAEWRDWLLAGHDAEDVAAHRAMRRKHAVLFCSHRSARGRAPCGHTYPDDPSPPNAAASSCDSSGDTSSSADRAGRGRRRRASGSPWTVGVGRDHALGGGSALSSSNGDAAPPRTRRASAGSTRTRRGQREGWPAAVRAAHGAARRAAAEWKSSFGDERTPDAVTVVRGCSQPKPAPPKLEPRPKLRADYETARAALHAARSHEAALDAALRLAQERLDLAKSFADATQASHSRQTRDKHLVWIDEILSFSAPYDTVPTLTHADPHSPVISQSLNITLGFTYVS